MTIKDFLDPQDWLVHDSGPRYVRLRRRIEQGIQTGLLRAGASLPAERDIAALTGLSRVTVRHAIKDLVDDGMIVQRQGSGSVVSDQPVMASLSQGTLTSFSQDLALRGLRADSTLIEAGIAPASPAEIVALALSPGDNVSRVHRLRLADERPVAIERAALPVDILPRPDAVGASLYEALAANGNRPQNALQRISAINLDAGDADLLGVPPGSAALRIERTAFLSSRRAIEFTCTIYRADSYYFVAELQLAGAGGDDDITPAICPAAARP